MNDTKSNFKGLTILALLHNPYLHRFGVYKERKVCVRDAKACTQFVAREEEKLALISSSLLCMFITTDAHIFFMKLNPKIYLAIWLLVKCLDISAALFPAGMSPSVIHLGKKPFKDLEVL